MKKMNSRIKKLWINALISGEYTQGQEVLREDNKFCCLGVLCDLAVKEKVIPEPTLFNDISGTSGKIRLRFKYGRQGSISYIPGEVLSWAGMGVSSNPLGGLLVQMNDRGEGFEKISKVIEEQL